MSKNKSLSSLPRRSMPGKYIPSASLGYGNEYFSKQPSWRFSGAWRGNPKEAKVEFYGFSEIQKQSQHLLEQLVKFEGRQWSEILVSAKKFNHAIDVSNLSKDAQRIIQVFQPNLEKIISLRFSGEERLFGRIEGQSGAFVILFWDPHHKICPSVLKHT